MNNHSWTKVAVSAIGLLFIVAVLGSVGTCGALRIMHGHANALAAAQNYAKVFPDTSDVICEKYDKNADGRIDCVIFRKQGAYVKLVCDGWTLFMHEGCSLQLGR